MYGSDLLDRPTSAMLSHVLDADDAAAFDNFMRDAPFGAYQQTRAWAAAAPRHARRGWQFFICRADGEIVGAAVIRSTRLAAKSWLATLQRGPVVHDPAALPLVLGALHRALKQAGCCSVQAAPRVRGRPLPLVAEAMRDGGYVPLPAEAQALHHVSGIVWLDKPEAAILAGFKQRARRALRAAEKAGITVRPVAGEDDLKTYQHLLDRFAASRSDYDMSGQPDARGQAHLIERSGGAMLLAERDGVAVGAHAFVRQGDEAIWLSLVTLDRDGASPGYPLLWQAMRTAAAMGCVGYDLAGLPDDEPADAGEAGRVQFKTAFAPHRRVMPPMQMLVLQPVQHLLLFGARAVYRRLRRASARRG
ncbi:GNAT family N-acetyltransferase [Sphingomonas palmae]|nr:GNAT family N-acetyltransferase [Sphingomonas palmae]